MTKNNSEFLNDNLIFEFVKPKNNDCFSKMNKNELQEFKYYLEKYYLNFRNILEFSNDITFGLELEFENAKLYDIYKKINKKQLKKWELKSDSSLKYGAEVASPILHNSFENWMNLKNVCESVNLYANIGENSGGHIHIGSKILEENYDYFLKFIKLWAVYENIIYRFSYGEYLNARSSIEKYARPVEQRFWATYKVLKTRKILNKDDFLNNRNIGFNKFQGVNFISLDKHGTIEFRCPNGTLNPIIWQNNVNLFVNLLLYSKSFDFNDDIIDNRRSINKENNINYLSNYNKIYLDQALELSDLIFNNNYDKVYFLKQYLKSFEVSDKSFEKAKTFTK